MLRFLFLLKSLYSTIPLNTPVVLSLRFEHDLQIYLNEDGAKIKKIELFPPDPESLNVARFFKGPNGFVIKFGAFNLCRRLSNTRLFSCRSGDDDEDVQWDIQHTNNGVVIMNGNRCVTAGMQSSQDDSYELNFMRCANTSDQIFEIREVPVVTSRWRASRSIDLMQGKFETSAKDAPTYY